MTKEHFSALLTTAEAETHADGWAKPSNERTVSLHVSHDGATLTVGQLIALRLDGELVLGRNAKGEQFLLALGDIFAGSVGAAKEKARQAGFR
jgi:hypothetical protein